MENGIWSHYWYCQIGYFAKAVHASSEPGKIATGNGYAYAMTREKNVVGWPKFNIKSIDFTGHETTWFFERFSVRSSQATLSDFHRSPIWVNIGNLDMPFGVLTVTRSIDC